MSFRNVLTESSNGQPSIFSVILRFTSEPIESLPRPNLFSPRIHARDLGTRLRSWHRLRIQGSAPFPSGECASPSPLRSSRAARKSLGGWPRGHTPPLCPSQGIVVEVVPGVE